MKKNNGRVNFIEFSDGSEIFWDYSGTSNIGWTIMIKNSDKKTFANDKNGFPICENTKISPGSPEFSLLLGVIIEKYFVSKLGLTPKKDAKIIFDETVVPFKRSLS